MNELVEQVKNIDNSSILSSIDDISLDNNICLEYVDNWGNKYYFNNKTTSCLLGKNKNIDKELVKIKQSQEEIF